MVGEVVDSRRRELGWSIKVTAERCGLHYDMISRLVRGRNEDLRLSTMRKLSNGLGISIAELAGMPTDGQADKIE